MRCNNLLERFSTGCNYWASNAGCFMWSDWDAAVVEKDFKLLSGRGLKTLRVFPLWSDFQPLTVHYGEFGRVKEVRRGELPLDGDTPESLACIEPIMVERFEKMCELAESYGLELTVMLLTGWMSGRQFKPQPLHGKNIYTDPFALKWQVRFVDYFVSRFKDRKCIVGWGLGNETNVMSPLTDSDASYSWAALISKTIRSADPTRPVISGMHGLTPDGSGLGWKISEQGELTDILTTHPYALFVKYLDGDKLLSIRNTMNTAAESTLYADLTGKPCMSEELGDLGSGFIDPQSSKTYLKTCLWSAWANNDLGLLWWCAFQQQNIDNTPYDWFAFEQELGLFMPDGTEKPTLAAFDEFHKAINSLPQELRKLPPRRRDAVCILTNGQDNWAAALSTFVLSKQAGFDVRFTTADKPLPESSLYIVPSVCGYNSLTKRMWTTLIDRVKNEGASLYISSYDALLPNLADFAGIKVLSRSKCDAKNAAYFNDNAVVNFPGDTSFSQWHREGGFSSNSTQYKLELEVTTAEVLAADEIKNPLFTRNKLGKGEVYFLNFGLEMILAKNSFSYEPNNPDYSRFYRTIADRQISQRCVHKNAEDIGLILSEFEFDDHIICVGVNHYCKPVKTTVRLGKGLKLQNIYCGNISNDRETLTLSLDKADVFIIRLTR